MRIPTRCFSSLKAGDIIHITHRNGSEDKWYVFIDHDNYLANKGHWNIPLTPNTFHAWDHISIIKVK